MPNKVPVMLLPLYCPSSTGADKFRRRWPWVDISCAPSFCWEPESVGTGLSESEDEAGGASCPRSALFSLSSCLISLCMSEITCAKLCPLSMPLKRLADPPAAHLSPPYTGPLPECLSISVQILSQGDYVAFHHLYSWKSSCGWPFGTLDDVLLITHRVLSFVFFNSAWVVQRSEILLRRSNN